MAGALSSTARELTTAAPLLRMLQYLLFTYYQLAPLEYTSTHFLTSLHHRKKAFKI